MSRPVDAPLIAEMLRQHGAALELFAAQWTTAAEDCVQDALVKLAGQAVMPKNPRAWLYRVVRNRALNMARSANRREAHEQVAARLHAKDHPAVDVAEVGDALATLPDDAREAIVLRVWGELTWEEIATVAGSSSSTMQRRYTEGLRALREIWEVETCPTNTESPAS